MTDRGPLNIAVAEPWCKPGDVTTNLEAIIAMAREAASRGADAIVFSESAITGYDFVDRGLGVAMPADDPRLLRLASLARELGLVIIAGFHERADGLIYNSAVIAQPDGHRLIQRKHLLSDREQGKVVAGQRQRLLFNIGHAQAVLLICADTGIPGIFEEVAHQGANVTICITAGCGSTDRAFFLKEMADPTRRKAYLQAAQDVCYPQDAVRRTFEFGYAFVGCNQMGYDAALGYFHPGHSFVVDCDGSVAALNPGCMIVEHLRPRLAIGQIYV